ncbi:hypothetical protein WN943_013176 [Citrus x changshan-huyou]
MEIKINGNGAGKKPIVFPHPHSIGINLETEIDITIAISHSLFRSYSYTHYEIKWSFCEAEKHPHVEVEQRQYFVERNQYPLLLAMAPVMTTSGRCNAATARVFVVMPLPSATVSSCNCRKNGARGDAANNAAKN